LDLLDLQQCGSIDDDELASLAVSLGPKCKVIDYYGQIVGEDKQNASDHNDERRDEGDKQVYTESI